MELKYASGRIKDLEEKIHEITMSLEEQMYMHRIILHEHTAEIKREHNLVKNKVRNRMKLCANI